MPSVPETPVGQDFIGAGGPIFGGPTHHETKKIIKIEMPRRPGGPDVAPVIRVSAISDDSMEHTASDLSISVDGMAWDDREYDAILEVIKNIL